MILGKPLVAALNHLLKHETWATTRLRKHAGATARIEGGPLRITLKIDDHGLFTADSPAEQADVVISLPADLPVLLLLEREQLFSSVRLSGSVDLAETLGFVFRNLSWDVEADLAAIIGDIAAHRLVRFGRSLGLGLVDALRRTGVNITEFVREESGLAVSAEELVRFQDGVATLRDDLARLEKRIGRLD